MKKICLKCGKGYTLVRRSADYVSKSKFCSRKCYKSYGDQTWYKNGHEPKVDQKGSKNHQWKGDRVGYSALHKWINNYLTKPNQCALCETTVSSRFEWANVSGKYLRNFSDWFYLCKSCHTKYDRFLSTSGLGARKVGLIK